jgi:hypothetical protein
MIYFRVSISGLQFYCRAIGEHFCSTLHYHRRCQLNAHDRIGIHFHGIVDHPLQSLLARLCLEFCVLFDFTADYVF